jgi:hypothetical protein
VGTAALKGILRHPQLELAGVKVYTDAKEGLDAGDIVGEEKTGVVATKDVDAILALDADCVIYSPMPWDVNEVVRILESGKHVITPFYIFPFIQIPKATALIEEACRRGNVNLHGSGCNPGGIAERFPLTFSGWCNRIDRIVCTECGDCRHYESKGVVMEAMNFGKTPEEAVSNPLAPVMQKAFNESIDMIAQALGCEVVAYEREHHFGLAKEPIETAAGLIEQGRVALNHYRYIGKTREGTEIVQQQIWYMDDSKQTRIDGKVDLPRERGWRIEIEGDVNLVVDVDGPSELSPSEHTAQLIGTTGFHMVNAVPLVCEAENPGIKTYLDLPRSTARMGTHEFLGGLKGTVETATDS